MFRECECHCSRSCQVCEARESGTCQVIRQTPGMDHLCWFIFLDSVQASISDRLPPLLDNLYILQTQIKVPGAQILKPINQIDVNFFQGVLFSLNNPDNSKENLSLNLACDNRLEKFHCYLFQTKFQLLGKTMMMITFI